jgi:glycosyltransferase involved in cell wall biosynthesis
MEKFDIFEGLNLPLVTSPVGVNIFTIHDIRGIGVASSILERYSFEFALRSAFERADHIVTVSETMKRAILDLYPDLSVSVIYNGLPDRAYERVSSEQLESVRLKYSIAGDFILAVGHLERRKNYGRLISAFARLRESDFDVSLVIIGNDSGELSAIRDVIDVEGVRDRVIILGGLSDFDVHCIYRLCKLFVFPSLYEGFGIPILEAMAAGCPMVLSDIPVFREITQSQGVYFDPLNVDSMVLCMETVLASDLVRSCVIEYGDRRVQEFSYAGLAVQLKDIYLGLI